MSAVAHRRTPAERAMLEYLRADAWRWDDPAERERIFLACIQVPGRFSAYELNVLYEMLILGSTVEAILAFEGGEDLLRNAVEDDGFGSETLTLPTLPYGLMITVSAILEFPDRVLDAGEWIADERAKPIMENETVARRAVDLWRDKTKDIRKSWPAWSMPAALPGLVAMASATIGRDMTDALGPAVAMACESLMRITWLYECEGRDSITFGPVSERRLSHDPAEQVIALRRFAEQQPELRKVPSFVHVAPRDPSAWMRPRDYPRSSHPPIDDRQVQQIAVDALTNRRYVHDHLAMIEVDRKPIKMIVLAPEVYDRRLEIVFLDALIVHEKGTFAVEVIVNCRIPEAPRYSTSLPFGSYAWRAIDDYMPASPAESELPPDKHVCAVVIAAWRDLIVPKVREEQYETTVERGGPGKDSKRPERQKKRGHTRVVRYLPRTVVARREDAAERASTGVRRHLSRPFRVGAFARLLRPGTKRSEDARDFAEEIGMPLRDDQTVVRPHIRGGTDEEREAMLAQDDVRLWRSWAALDLLYATRTPGAVE